MRQAGLATTNASGEGQAGSEGAANATGTQILLRNLRNGFASLCDMNSLLAFLLQMGYIPIYTAFSCRESTLSGSKT
jgi:hypothetical protein